MSSTIPPSPSPAAAQTAEPSRPAASEDRPAGPQAAAPPAETTGDFWESLRAFVGEFRQWRWSIVCIVLLSFGTGVLETAAITLAVVTLGAVMMPDAAQLPVFLGIALPSPGLAISLGFLAVLVRWVFATFNDWLMLRTVVHWAVALRARLFETFMRAEWRQQSAERTAAVQERVFQNTTLVSNLQQQFFAVVQATISLFAILAGAFLVSPWGAAAAMAVSLALMLLLRPLSRWASRSSRQMVSTMMRSAELVRSCLDMVRELTVFGAKEPARRAIVQALRRQEAHRERALLLSAVSSQIYFSLVLLACWIAIATLRLVDPEDVLALGAVGLLLLRSLGYTRSIQSGFVRIRAAMPLYEDLVSFERRLGPPAEDLRVPGRIPESFDLRLEGVSFVYPDGHLPALSELTFDVPAGSSLAVVGASGSGKSTLAQILLGLRQPTAGRLTVGGVALQEVDVQWWRSATAVVTQENLLLDATVRENVRLFRSQVDDRAIGRVLEQVGLQEFVEAQPEGLDTHVGEHGARLSGGQRQRLCIARALVGEPKILVLDEPTSALDVHSERIVQQCLEGLGEGCTRVVIAHRLSTIRQCSRVVVLEDGRVLDIGSPAALEERLEYFRQALQLSDTSASDEVAATCESSASEPA